MTNKGSRPKQPSKRTGSKVKRSPALVPAPEKLALLVRLVNLLPKFLHRSPSSPDAEPNARRGVNHWDYVRHWWDTKDDVEAISSTYHLRRLVDELPPELQAFVWYDDDGRHTETTFGYEPLFDPHHLQPLTNITLLGQSEREVSAVVAGAKERIDIETKLAEARISSRNREQRPFEMFNDYKIGDSKFREVGLRLLADRAKKRFFFIVAAEEILDALVGPDTQKKLSDAWYVEKPGATGGRLYVSNDEVKYVPSILFSFVIGIQPSRIRRCGICENYFWAGRKDKKLCSERCSAVSRKRQERQRYFDRKIGIRRRRGKRGKGK